MVSRAVAALFALVLAAAPLAAQTFPDPPEGAILDLADLLPPEAEAALEARIAEAEARTGVPVRIVTFEGLPADAPAGAEAYTSSLSADWGLGADGDLAIMFAIYRGLGELWIDERNANAAQDGVVERIVNETIVPAFSGGDFATGITAGTERLLVEIAGFDPDAQVAPASETEGGGGLWWLLALLGLPVAGIGYGAYRSKARLAATPCPACGATGTLSRSRLVIAEATTEAEGRGETVTTCSACGQSEATPYTIPRKKAEAEDTATGGRWDAGKAASEAAKSESRGNLSDLRRDLGAKSDTRSDSSQR